MTDIKKELLAVLDLPEDERQIRKLYELGYTDCFVRLHCGRNGIAYECKTGSLADLAFRLRDEVDFNLYIETLEDVYLRWFKKQEKPCLITFACWLAVYITPIDRTIAALIAKLLAKGE